MAQQTFSGVPGTFSAGEILTATDQEKLREFILYFIKDGDETDTGEVSPLILDLGSDIVNIVGQLVVGVDGTGHDVTFFGDTAGSYALWDQSEDELRLIDSLLVVGNTTDAVDMGLVGGVATIRGINVGASAYNDLEIRAQSGTHLKLTTGGLVALGGAIAFNGDVAAANQLDTYEEGVWSPTYISSNGDMSGVTVNASFTKGTYVRIGRQVWVNCFIRTDSITTLGTGNVRISGLPYDSYNVAGYNQYPSAVRTIFAFDSDGPTGCSIPNNDNFLNLWKTGSAGAVDEIILATDLSSSAARNGICFQVTYITDAAA